MKILTITKKEKIVWITDTLVNNEVCDDMELAGYFIQEGLDYPTVNLILAQRQLALTTIMFKLNTKGMNL